MIQGMVTPGQELEKEDFSGRKIKKKGREKVEKGIGREAERGRRGGGENYKTRLKIAKKRL